MSRVVSFSLFVLFAAVTVVCAPIFAWQAAEGVWWAVTR